MKALKIIDSDLLEKYKASLMAIEMDNEAFCSKAPMWLLDNFSHPLSLEEIEKVPFNFRDLNLKNEHKYLALFKALFNRNPAPQVIVKFDYRGMDENDHLNVMDGLDLYEKTLWIHQMLYLDRNRVTNYFLVDDMDLLMLLVKLNVRELAVVEIHFPDLGYAIVGNFDCVMSVFFYDESKIEPLSRMALMYDLYLRES